MTSLLIPTLFFATSFLLVCGSSGAANASSDSPPPIVSQYLAPRHSIEKYLPRLSSKSLTRSSHSVRYFAFLNTISPLSRQEQRQEGDALDGDPCGKDSDCRPPRRCLDTTSRLTNLAKTCSNSSETCFCVNHPAICVSEADCDDGEECVLDIGYPTCISINTVERLQLSAVPSPSADAPPPQFGFTGELCSSDSDCRGSRNCRPQQQPLSQELSCDPMYLTCSCVGETFTQCEDPIDEDEDDQSDEESDMPNQECPSGELCQTVGGNAICYTAKVRQKNISEAMEQDPPLPAVFAVNEAEEDAICIGMHSLRHLSQDQLLFSKPKMARVLCDSNESCATAGHMVSYEGELMMMKTYCERSSCTAKVMYVNSPRFRRAIRIDSNTESLSFTALAARYETGTEERLLSVAIRVGLL